MLSVLSWRPKKRNVTYQPRPDFVPEWVYTEAMTAKKFYNEDWEFWVYNEAKSRNCSQAIAEDACIRGLQKVLHQIDYVYGPKIAKWYREYLDMGDIFRKVRHPDYIKKLG